MIELTRDEAINLIETYLWNNNPDDYVTIAGRRYKFKDVERNVEEHRWTQEHMLVFSDGTQLWGLVFSQGSTEMQDDIDYFEYYNPALRPVKSKQITRYML